MEDHKIRYCKLCLTAILGENYEVIGNVTKDILSTLLLKLDFEDECIHVMCSVCSEKLFAAHKFKSICYHTDNAINSYTNDSSTLPLDLRDMCMKEGLNDYLSDDTKICRLCMQPIESVLEFSEIKEEQVDMIVKFVPEMNIFQIKDPVMCKLCLDSLVEHSGFLKKCSDAQQDIGYVSNERVLDAVTLAPSGDVCVKIEDVDMKFEEDAPELVEAEFVDVNINYGEFENDSEIHVEEIPCEASAYRNSETVSYKCNFCDYKVKRLSSLNKHKIINHHYEKYDDKTSHEITLEEYIQQNSLRTPIYKCEYCNYKSKFKGNLRAHALKHKDPSKWRIYKCEHCDYKGKSRFELKTHTLMHKDPSEVEMYQCTTCNYKTKYKTAMKPHMLKHKDSSEVQMYKCEICPFETKYWKEFKTHKLTHNYCAEVRIYKCEKCSYETKYKAPQHVSDHKDPSEEQVYKCENCNYESICKGYVKYMLVHKGPSELQLYKCGTCTYQTKYETTIKRHMLTHKDPSEVQMYNCETCDYKTKHKGSLKRHIVLKHEDPLKM